MSTTPIMEWVLIQIHWPELCCPFIELGQGRQQPDQGTCTKRGKKLTRRRNMEVLLPGGGRGCYTGEIGQIITADMEVEQF